MSNIIAKPFSWANKIVQAVFKGSPNLITTSDLNRQIEALKKEMYVLQQSSGVIISDLECSVTEEILPDKNTLSYSLSYVFCLGVKFDVSKSETVEFEGSTAVFRELRLYAKRELITSEDDFSKEISGAKFSDGTTQPAANHYVYSEPTVVWVDAGSDPNSDFVYPESSGKEYICTLLRFERRVDPSKGYYPSTYYVQKFTVPMGKGIVDVENKYRTFDQFELATKSNVAKTLVPGANDDWKTIVHKLWSRLYTLEKRLFGETLYGEDGAPLVGVTNGVSFSANRTFQTAYTSNTHFGKVDLRYNFQLIGNICFAAGHITFEKNDMENPTERILSCPIGSEDNELPRSLYYLDTSVALTLQNIPHKNIATAATGARGYIDRDKLIFSGVPAEGAAFYWYVVYCFSSAKFWDVSKDDRFGFFNDMR